MARTSIELRDGEELLCAKRAMLKAGKVRVLPADLTITNQRVVIKQYSHVLATLFGLLGSLFTRMATGKTTEMELSSITSVAQVKFGVNTNVLVFSGDTELTVIVKPGFDQAVDALKHAGIEVRMLS